MENLKAVAVTHNKKDFIKKIENASEKAQKGLETLKTAVIGQDDILQLTLITLLSGGHALLVGVPGLAKTRLVHYTAKVFGLESGRVQFTPDLMPADITGSEVLEENIDRKRSFRFIKGPVFCQLLMADEINRASPRTQSALLQAMQEHHITIAGKQYHLPKPFHVLATQNPIEQEGTYPLPEAQLDRFLYQIDISYPDLAAEKEILVSTTGTDEMTLKKQMTAKQLIDFQQLIRALPIGEKVVDSILSLIRQARPETTQSKAIKETVSWGPGPRAGQALMLGSRALAFLEGRLAPSIDDVKRLAIPAMRHRMALHYSAQAEGITLNHLIQTLIDDLE